MGLFDFFRSRRERESALPDGSQVAIGEPAGTGTEAAIGQTDLSALGDLGKLGGLGELIKQAASQGNLSVEVNEEPMQVMNLQGQGDGLRNAILETLRQHGIDAERGDQVQVTDPQLQQAIFKTLAQHGLDVSQMQGGSPLGAAELSTGEDSISQLERLQRLREQGVLSAEEFEQQKRKIISG
jgi:hypothetical protein